jgi:hypothetical protein
MAENIEIKIKAIIESADASKNIDELKNSLKELESIAENVDLSPDQLNELGGAMTDLSSKIQTSEANLENFDRGVKTVKASGDLLAGSIASVVGGLALFGVENEYINNLTQGAAGAVALSSGVAQAGDAIVQLSQNTKIATVAQRAFNIVANLNPYILGVTALVAAGAAIAGIATALQDTALESALANQSASELANTLIANENAASDLNLSVEDTVTVFNQAADEAQRQLDILNSSDETLKAQGLSEREILNLKIAQTDEVIALRKQAIEALREQKVQEIEKTERFAKATEVILQFLTAPVQLLLGAVDGIIVGLNAVGIVSDETFESIGSLREGFNEFTVGLIFDPEVTAAEADATIQEAESGLLALENQRAGYQNRITAIDQAAIDKRNAASQKAADDEKKRQEETTAKIIEENAKRAQEEADLLAQVEALENTFLDSQLTKQEREENAVRDKYFGIIEAARQAGLDLTTLEAAQEAELKAIRDTALEDRRTALDEEITLEQEKIAAKQQTLDNVIAIAGAETGVGRAALIAQQAINAQALIQDISKTIAFSQGALARSQVAVAEGTAQTAKIGFPQNIPLLVGYAAQAVGIIRAIRQATQRANVPPGPGLETGNLGNLGGGGGGSVSSPTFNPQQFFGLGQGNINPNTGGPQDTRVFVVESDITNTQNRVSVIEDRARIG